MEYQLHGDLIAHLFEGSGTGGENLVYGWLNARGLTEFMPIKIYVYLLDLRNMINNLYASRIHIHNN